VRDWLTAYNFAKQLKALFSWAAASIEAACRAIFSIPLSARPVLVRPRGVAPANPCSNLVPAADNDP
jgi:hypothetical protein